MSAGGDGCTVLRTYAEVLYPGSFMPEEQVVAVEDRDPQRMLAKLPAGAFAFRFFDRQEVPAEGGEALRGAARNYSSYFYLGEEFTTEEVDRQFPGPEHQILRFNLTANGFERAVRCRTGNWRPLSPGDVVLAARSSESGRRERP